MSIAGVVIPSLAAASLDPGSLYGLLLLGAVHGLNPAMGWLFAVALGMQRGEVRGVWAALGPLTLGHALAIAAAVGMSSALGLVVDMRSVRVLVAAALLALGLWQLRGHWHPRAGGMRVTPRQLTGWSFLVATAHGAGLMAVPLTMAHGGAASISAASRPVPGSIPSGLDRVLHGGMHGALHGGMYGGLHDGIHPASAVVGASVIGSATTVATLVHTAGYLLMTSLLAVVVYRRSALHLLRRAWVNLDVVWAGSLVVAAIAVLVL